MVYTAPCVMYLLRADTLRGQVGEGLALEIESFWASCNGIEPICECHLGPKNSRFPGPNPLPLAQVMDLPASKIITHRDV
jgi:hypothetical protein